MPALGRFLQKASHGVLTSVLPSVTIPAWYTAVTGRTPLELGTWGFTAPGERPGEFRLVTTYRPAEALWDTLGRQGWKVGVVNFPALPAPAVHGYFVSGMLAADSADGTFPAALAGDLSRRFGPWNPDLFSLKSKGLAQALDEARTSLRQKVALLEAWEAEDPRDLLFVLFSETDRLQHDFYDALSQAAHTGRGPAALFWRDLDESLRRILEAFRTRRPEGWIFLLSDHGFGPSEGYFFTNRFLWERGYLRVRPDPIPTLRPWVTTLLATLDRYVPLAPALNHIPPGSRSGAPSSPSFSRWGTDRTFSWFSHFVDWERTQAFSFPVPEAIYANHHRGELSPEERRGLQRRLREEFSRFPHARVESWAPEELYPGPVGPRTPLLILSVNGQAWETRGDLNYQRTYLGHRPSYFEREGCHRPEGILAVTGPGVPQGPLPGPLRLLDFHDLFLRLIEMGRWMPGTGGTRSLGPKAKEGPSPHG